MLKLLKFGGKKFKENWERIEAEVNQNKPVDGLGIICDATPNGTQVSTADAKNAAAGGAGSSSSNGSGGGSNVDLYGAYNGAPAVFHLKQSSAPTPL